MRPRTALSACANGAEHGADALPRVRSPDRWGSRFDRERSWAVDPALSRLHAAGPAQRAAFAESVDVVAVFANEEGYAMNWHESPTAIAALYAWLLDRDEAPEDVAYFIARAAKWQPEWERMQAEKDAEEAHELTSQLEASLPYVRLWRAVRAVRRPDNG